VPRERTYWLLLASLILIGLAGGHFRDRGPETVQLSFAPGAPAPVPQEAARRIWSTALFASVAEVPAGEGKPLQMPTLLRVDGQGNLFVLDSGDLRVKKFSPDGQPLNSYGTADLSNVMDVALSPSGEVWVGEPDRKRITIFSAAGAVARRIDLDETAVRLGLSPQGSFVATRFAGSEGLFHRYSAAGKPAGSFSALFPDKFQNALAIDGWIVPAGAGSFLYIFRNTGLLAAYTWDGRAIFFRETVEPLPLPEIQIDPDVGQTIPPETPLASISGSVVGRDLWILSASSRGRVLDRYDARTGTYQDSVEPPEKDARYVVLTADRLFSASRRGVTIWRWAS
jgi:hypothetical protein